MFSLQPKLRKLLIITLLGMSSTSSLAKVLSFTLPSVAIGDSTNIIIATPTDFDPEKEVGYPFILMLHGWSGDETQWKENADLQAMCDTHDILLVLPDGDYNSWWVNSMVQPHRNYDTHLHVELKSWVIATFNGSPIHSKQGILGLSMGGYGAMHQVLTHPQQYAAAASLSGVMDITRHQDQWQLAGVLGAYPNYPDRWKHHNPLDLAQIDPPPLPPGILLICGTDDFAYDENQDMATRLTENNYDIQFLEPPGSHTHSFWQTHINTAVEFIVDHF